MEKEIGKVIHWFDHIMVAVLRLDGELKLGDKIKVVKGDNEFEDVIESMQINKENVNSAGKGEEVAIKLSEKTKEGAKIFLLE